jgi:hypothetical protein
MVLSTTFTGSNGAAWPSPWSTSLQGGTTGGAIDIQSNRGRMRAHDGAYRRARASAAVTVANATLTATFNLSGIAEQYGYLWFRTSGDWLAGEEWEKKGYALYVGAYPSGELGLIRVNDAGVDYVMAGSAFAWTAGVDYKAKINFVGTTIRAKVWLASGSEPGAWNLETSDGAYSSGGVDVSLLSGGTSGNREWTVDDIVATATNPAANTESEWTGYLTAATGADPGGTLASSFTAYVEATTPAAPAGQVRKFRRGGAWVDTSDRKLRRAGIWV